MSRESELRKYSTADILRLATAFGISDISMLLPSKADPSIDLSKEPEKGPVKKDGFGGSSTETTDNKPRPKLRDTLPPDFPTSHEKKPEPASDADIRMVRDFLQPALDKKDKVVAQDESKKDPLQRRPVHFGIFDDDMMRRLLVALCGRQLETGRPHISRTVRMMSKRCLPKRLPRLPRTSVRPRLLIIRDTNPGMFPFQRDISQLISSTKMLMGSSDNVIEHSYDGSGEILSADDIDNTVTAVLLVSDLHGFSEKIGAPCSTPRDWMALKRLCRDNNATLTILSPGEFSKRSTTHSARQHSAWVARPAYAEFFEENRKLFPIVPWSDSQNPGRIRAYAKGAQHVGFFGPKDSWLRHLGRNVPGSLGQLQPEKQLAQLLTLSSDFDVPTLRSLRVGMSRPELVAKAYGIDFNLRKITPISASPLTELLVWTSDLFDARKQRSTYSANHTWLQSNRPHLDDEKMGPHYKFARAILEEVRAKRAATQLTRDRMLWQDLGLNFAQNANSPAAPADVMAALTRIDQNSALPNTAPTGDAVKGDAIGVGLTKDRVSFGINMQAPDIFIPLPDAVDRSNIKFTLLNEKGKAPTQQEKMLFSRLDRNLISLDWNDATVLMVQFSDGTRRFVRRPTDANIAQPLFTHSGFTDNGDIFRFKGDDLIVDGQCYDIVSMTSRDPEPQNSSVLIENPDGVENPCQTPSGFVGNIGERWIVCQRDPESPALSAVLLTARQQDENPKMATGPGGVVSLGYQETYLATETAEGDLRVSLWQTGDRNHSNPFHSSLFDTFILAVSSNGAVVLRGKDQKYELVWLEAALDTNSKPRMFQLPVIVARRATALAISQSGLIALKDGNGIDIFAPAWQLEHGLRRSETSLSGKFGREDGLPAIAVSKVETMPREWQGLSSSYEAELAACICDETPARSLRLSILGPSREVKVRPEILQGYLNVETKTAELISAIWNGQAELAEGLLDAEPQKANWFDPKTGLTLLHIAAFRTSSEALLLRLADGHNVNQQDFAGATPLLMASMCDDGGNNLTTLLNLGGDPKNTVDTGYGVNSTLFNALFMGLYSNKLPQPSLINQLMDAGAPLGGVALKARTMIHAAATYGDSNIFDRILSASPTPSADLSCRDNAGWTALAIAAYKGHEDIVRICLEKSTAFSRRDTTVIPIAIAVHANFPEIVCAILEKMKQERPDTWSTHPDMRYLRQAIDNQYFYSEGEHKSALRDILEHMVRQAAPMDAEPWPLTNKYGLFETSPKEGELLFDYLELLDDGDLKIIRTIEQAISRSAGATKVFEDDSLFTGTRMGSRIDPGQITDTGQTLAHFYAAYWKNEQENGANPFKLLAERGLDVTLVDENGYSPLHVAALADNLPAIEALIDLSPGLIELSSNKGLLPRDLSPDASKAGDLLMSNIPFDEHLPMRTNEDFAISFLSENTEWEDVPGLPKRRIAGLDKATSADGYEGRVVRTAIPPLSGYWWPQSRRRAKLPYGTPTYLEETWWMRSDGTIGVSGRLVAEDGEIVTELTGVSVPIHSTNWERGLELDTHEKVIAYLHFFCAALRADQGNFMPVFMESQAQALGLPDTISYEPPQCKETFETRDKGTGDEKVVTLFATKGHVVYDEHLFESQFVVESTGDVIMAEDLVIDDVKIPTKSWRDGTIMFRE